MLFFLLACDSFVAPLPAPACSGGSDVALDTPTPEGPTGIDVLDVYRSHTLVLPELPDLDAMRLLVPEPQAWLAVDTDPACGSMLSGDAELEVGDSVLPVASFFHTFDDETTTVLVRAFVLTPSLEEALTDAAIAAGAPEEVEILEADVTLTLSGAHGEAEFRPKTTVGGERWYAETLVRWSTTGSWRP